MKILFLGRFVDVKDPITFFERFKRIEQKNRLRSINGWKWRYEKNYFKMYKKF